MKNKTSVSTFNARIQHRTGSSIHSDQTRKRNKRHPNWKGGSKAVIIGRGHDIENLVVSNKKLPNLISESGKVAGCKVNIQKLMAFLYTNNEISGKNYEKILFTIATRKIKYLGLNLMKKVKDVY